MTRQIDENILNKKLLNKKEAAAYLEIGIYLLNSIIKSGELSFKTVGKRLKFPIWALDEWQKSTTHHIDYTNAETSTTPISRVLSKDKESSFAKVRERFLLKQQQTIASSVSQRSRRKPSSKQLANYPV